MDYKKSAYMEIWNIITEYLHDDEVQYLKEVWQMDKNKISP